MRFRVLALPLAFLAVGAAPLNAQAFKAGTNYIGPSISLATYGSTVAFEGNFEHAINDKWGWGLSAGYWSYGVTDFNYHVIPVAGTAAYHFTVSNEKLDPFVGGSVGVFIFSCSGAHGDCGAGARSTGLLIGPFGGVRYWLKDNLALTGRVGYGIGFLTAGVDFKM
jgi:hypothetical protein